MNQKIVIVISKYRYFLTHRLQLAREAVSNGYDVTVVTNTRNEKTVLSEPSLTVVHMDIRRSADNPWQDLKTLINLMRLYRSLQPVLVHHVSLKVIILGGIAALMAKVPIVLNAMTGLGYVFSSGSSRAKLLRIVIRPFLKFILHRTNSYTIFQNLDDLELLKSQDLIEEEHAVLIKGAGVNTEEFFPAEFPPDPFRVVFPARMLVDKGINEFLEAARLLHEDNLNVRMILVGEADDENPMSIDPGVLQTWSDNGLIEWWGYREKMLEVYHQAHIVCLPSYREGFPKVLLEAAACGRPLITTDVPGCREAVIDGKTGILIPVRNAEAIADAVRRFYSNRGLLDLYGNAGLEYVRSTYTTEMINNQTIDLYKDSMQACRQHN